VSHGVDQSDTSTSCWWPCGVVVAGGGKGGIPSASYACIASERTLSSPLVRGVRTHGAFTGMNRALLCEALLRWNQLNTLRWCHVFTSVLNPCPGTKKFMGPVPEPCMIVSASRIAPCVALDVTSTDCSWAIASRKFVCVFGSRFSAQASQVLPNDRRDLIRSAGLDHKHTTCVAGNVLPRANPVLLEVAERLSAEPCCSLYARPVARWCCCTAIFHQRRDAQCFLIEDDEKFLMCMHGWRVPAHRALDAATTTVSRARSTDALAPEPLRRSTNTLSRVYLCCSRRRRSRVSWLRSIAITTRTNMAKRSIQSSKLCRTWSRSPLEARSTITCVSSIT
jgi:hypothetical protein